MIGARADGAEILEEVEEFVGRFIAYPDVHSRVAHVLWIAHTYFMEEWDSTPRIAFLSPEPGSGKSRALEVTEPLVPRPVHAVNTTSAYLFRRIGDPDGLPTILFDEIDTIFGPKAKEQEDIRGVLNAGHRKGAIAGRCTMRGATVITEDLPAYCPVAFAGLGNLPVTLMDRSVVVRMRRRAPNERVEPWRPRIFEKEATELAGRLKAWADERRNDLRLPDQDELPDEIIDRKADVWEALIAVAALAGNGWPARSRVAAVTLVTLPGDLAASLGVQLLGDLRDLYKSEGVERMTTKEIVTLLAELPERPWGALDGRGLDERRLAKLLRPYDVSSRQYRIGERVVRGYLYSDLIDPFTRYLDPELPEKRDFEDPRRGDRGDPQNPATTATTATTRPDLPTPPRLPPRPLMTREDWHG